ncbi:MAG: signal peptidase I [Candidatus Gracilibacteria bacterium]
MSENEILEKEIVSSTSTEETTPIAEIPNEEPSKTPFHEIIEFFRDIIIILVVVIFVRTYIAAPFQISGSSMEESYHDREFILVNKFSYADFGFVKVGDPVRGDVVILRPHASNGKEYYIKRVVGIPGDTIRFSSGNVLLKESGKMNFVQLDERYLSLANNGKTFLPIDVKETEFAVPVGEYFVMGDNRNNSSDSRACFQACSISGSTHFVSQSNVIGKLFVDFGYINIFREGGVTTTGKWIWTHDPRFLSTPKDWIYKELSSL